jgi:hypothetical protein
LLRTTAPIRITFLPTAQTITMADEAAACFSLKMMTGGILTLFKQEMVTGLWLEDRVIAHLQL